MTDIGKRTFTLTTSAFGTCIQKYVIERYVCLIFSWLLHRLMFKQWLLFIRYNVDIGPLSRYYVDMYPLSIGTV